MTREIRKFYNAFLFNAASPVIREALRGPLHPSDLPELPPELKPETPAIQQLKLNTKSPTSLVVSLFWHFRREMSLLLILILARAAFSLSLPPVVRMVIASVREAADGGGVTTGAVLSAVALAVVNPGIGILMQHYFFLAIKLHQKIALSLSQLLYRHTLELRFAHKRDVQTGDMVNHMSADTDVMCDAAMSIPESAMYLIILAGGLAMLFFLAGKAAFAGIAVFAILIPLTKAFAKRYTAYDTRLLEAFDKRVTFFSQILNGIRVVKYFGWTRGIETQISQIREQELHARKRYAITHATGNLFFMSANVLAGIAIFATAFAQNNTLNAETVFACIATFGILSDPMRYLSHYISDFINMRVASGRLQKFLSQEHQPAPALPLSKEKLAVGLVLDDVSVRYPHTAGPTISHVCLNVAAGESVAIVGGVGCGKSTLLAAILDEIPMEFGSISFTNVPNGHVPRVAYVPQEPFTLNASLRENIAFGGSLKETEAAARAASLEEDIAALPHGLDTEIGEHGVNLSGGQKQRVALARAVLCSPGIVFLDDPFSALDPKTELEICNNLLFGIWENITRIVVTHRLSHINRFQKIVFMENGVVADSGTFDELCERSSRFREFVRHSLSEHVVDSVTEPVSAEIPISHAPTSVRITEDEDRSHGTVKAGIYWDFLSAFGGKNKRTRPWILAVFFIAILASVLVPLAQNAWMAKWTDSLQSFPNTEHSWRGIAVYGALGLLVMLTAFLKEGFTLLRAIEAGKSIHERALHGVLNAPLRFFDSTPSGRILNRFSRDQFSIESELSWRFLEFFSHGIQLIITFSVIAAVIPQLIVPLVPVLFTYYWMQKLYRPAARDTKRLDSISRSPRFAHYKETLAGLAVIRAFSQQQLFYKGFQKKLETSVRMFMGQVLVNRWFSIRMPILSGVVTLATTLSILYMANKHLLLPGMAGLIITYTQDFAAVLNWTIRAFSEVEARLTAVERLSHYSKLTPEPDTTKTPVLANHTPWPTRGSIEFHKVVARYAPQLPLVLKGVSFKIPSGERAGISGRTGSGKSTILQVLFRTIPVEEGLVSIDGVDIASVPLERLRKSIAIIPQFPTLFMGTLRKNLDYFETASDTEIWSALERVRLAHVVRNLPEGLQTPVAESGSNFSVGQKQLLCLARAFLNKSKMIVMDEATASVDVETDAQIQTAIREECKGITVMIIAHRLSTIADCPVQIPLEEGRVTKH